MNADDHGAVALTDRVGVLACPGDSLWAVIDARRDRGVRNSLWCLAPDLH
ncbi:MAG: hypothetical protein QNM02_10395 [Acidimicrobiia bacterium]|nr:hypothetical protein [Acidimicrobiia bacterium]